ncbi:hypothetical protein [Crenothrix sp.]|uniref:hypothetical protein n=1 Tax=Crenothrix sp. TaxID=3100433 RepID=UPI00374CAF5D
MKKNIFVKLLWIALALCVSTLVSAAPNLNGSWKGAARKVSTTACSVPVSVVLTITQCKIGGSPGNLFNGTLKVGSNSLKIVGRIDPDSTIQANGIDVSLTTGSSKSVFLSGKLISAGKIQITQFNFTSSATAAFGNEMYDIITLSK